MGKYFPVLEPHYCISTSISRDLQGIITQSPLITSEFQRSPVLLEILPEFFVGDLNFSLPTKKPTYCCGQGSKISDDHITRKNLKETENINNQNRLLTSEELPEDGFQIGGSKESLLVGFSKIVSETVEADPLSLEVEVGKRPLQSHPVAYNRLMKAYSHVNNVDEVLRLFHEMKDSQCKPNILCFNTVLNTLIATKHFKVADSLLEAMSSLQLNPNLSTFNILVKAYACCSHQFNSAYKIINWMIKSDIRPDVTTYSTLITGLCKVGRITEAYNVLNQMLEESCCPNIFTFTPILQVLYAHGMTKEARNLIGFMLKKGCHLNTVAYNIVIHGLCQNKDFGEVKGLLKESPRLGWKPNSISYNIFMNALCKVGRVMDAYGLLKSMRKNGLCPTPVTLNILLDCLCQASLVNEAESLLWQSSELKWEVDVVSYNTVMSRFCGHKGWRNVLKLLASMMKKGVHPNDRTYNIALNSLCQAGEIEKAKYFVIKGSVSPNIVTYNILLGALYRAKKTSEVQALYMKMIADQIAPDIFTKTIEISALCKAGNPTKASELLLESVEMGFMPDLVMYSALIDGLAKHGKLSEATHWLKKMLKQGLVPNVSIFDSIIRGFCGKGYCGSGKFWCLCVVVDEMIGKI